MERKRPESPPRSRSVSGTGYISALLCTDLFYFLGGWSLRRLHSQHFELTDIFSLVLATVSPTHDKLASSPTSDPKQCSQQIWMETHGDGVRIPLVRNKDSPLPLCVSLAM
jgi:hypothetical protein